MSKIKEFPRELGESPKTWNQLLDKINEKGSIKLKDFQVIAVDKKVIVRGPTTGIFKAESVSTSIPAIQKDVFKLLTQYTKTNPNVPKDFQRVFRLNLQENHLFVTDKKSAIFVPIKENQYLELNSKPPSIESIIQLFHSLYSSTAEHVADPSFVYSQLRFIVRLKQRIHWFEPVVKFMDERGNIFSRSYNPQRLLYVFRYILSISHDPVKLKNAPKGIWIFNDMVRAIVGYYDIEGMAPHTFVVKTLKEETR